MKEILITSSVLIAALLVLRRMFRKSISRRAQYALWGLVLARLLLPVNLPAVEHNVLTTAAPVQAAVTQRLETPRLYGTPVSVSPAADFPEAKNVQPGQLVPTAQSFGYPVLSSDGTTVTTYANRLDRPVTLAENLTVIWYTGIAVVAVWFLLSNLLFWQKLRKSRTPYPAENCEYPVYLVEYGLSSPCLFGLLRPAVYLTPAAVSSPEALHHVLAHEETHARHLDPLWSLLRAVCLVVYWFDPLVWAAAIASRNDCELACDEGAIRRLGEDERISYGKTLLSLIPLRRGPSNPLLSATTMTAGKRQLKDRITRIAENGRTVGIALFAVIAIAGVVCAATFTGAASKAPEEPDGVQKADAVQKADGPLTGDELRHFNQAFFNGDGFNIRNQFLSSTYEKPEDIDFTWLLYDGTGLPANVDEAERQAVALAGFDGEDPGIDLTKCSAGAIDQVLLENTGLTLAQTNRIGLDAFTYLPDYDAYYHFHGDTNYRSWVDIAAGERKDGLIHLYYEDDFLPDGWKCVTLRETPEGGYWFVSNLLSEAPAIPTVYPAGEPWMTIPLEGLTPSGPQALEVERRARDDMDRPLHRILIDETGTYDPETETVTDARILVIYQSVDGTVRAAVENQTLDCFFTFPENVSAEYAYDHIDSFNNLFSHSGAVLSYRAQKDGEYYTTFNDYYTVDESGVPYLLARAYGDKWLIDLDGNGQQELVSAGSRDAQIFFQRNGRLYEADITALLPEHWTEPVSLYPSLWSKYDRCLYLSGEVPFPGVSGEYGQPTGTASRELYFDGENLLLYKDNRTSADHVMEGIDAPEDVLDAAKTAIHDDYEYMRMHTGVIGGGGEMIGTPAEYDDWRIENLEGPYFENIAGASYEIWNFNYEFHTTTPERVILAGGCYLTEDAWYCPTYPDCTYLYFQLSEDGSRRYLYSSMENDCFPGTEMFRMDMIYTLEGMGQLSLADVEGEELLEMFVVHESSFMNNMAERAEGEAVIDNLRTFLISSYGGALEGLVEREIAFSAAYGDYSHEELAEYYRRTFNDMKADLTPGGLALWEHLTEDTAPAAGPLLPTLEDIQALAPAEVAEAVYQLGKANLVEFLRLDALYDGWRVSGLTRETGFETFGLPLSVYSVGFELHPSRLDKVELAGGMEFTEDGWIRGLMAYSPYLLFQTTGGHYTLLESDIPDDCEVGAPAFQADLAAALLKNGLIRPSQIGGETLLTMVGASTLNYLGTFPEEEQEAVITDLNAFHNKGPQERQMDLRDAIQTTVWTQRSLDAYGSAFFNKLLERTGIHAYGLGDSYSDLTSALHAAIVYWRQNASPRQADHYGAAHYALDTQWGGCGCTVYALVTWGEYDLTADGYQLGSSGSCNALAFSFAYVNGLYQLTEIWEPHGGGLYGPEIRACFTKEAADTVFSQGSREYAAIKESLDSNLDKDVKAWYESLA